MAHHRLVHRRHRLGQTAGKGGPHELEGEQQRGLAHAIGAEEDVHAFIKRPLDRAQRAQVQHMQDQATHGASGETFGPLCTVVGWRASFRNRSLGCFRGLAECIEEGEEQTRCRRPKRCPGRRPDHCRRKKRHRFAPQPACRGENRDRFSLRQESLCEKRSESSCRHIPRRGPLDRFSLRHAKNRPKRGPPAGSPFGSPSRGWDPSHLVFVSRRACTP